MKRNNFKKVLLCLALVLSLTVGTSLTVFAGTGNISFGGMTASWGLYSSYMSTTVTYTSPATLKASGNIHEYRSYTNAHKMLPCSGTATSSKKLSFTS